eukprot:2596907-Heterocapsa_arctica.AAC.1
MTASTTDGIHTRDLTPLTHVDRMSSQLKSLFVVITHEVVKKLYPPLQGKEVLPTREGKDVTTPVPTTLIDGFDTAVAVTQKVAKLARCVASFINGAGRCRCIETPGNARGHVADP